MNDKKLIIIELHHNYVYYYLFDTIRVEHSIMYVYLAISNFK